MMMILKIEIFDIVADASCSQVNELVTVEVDYNRMTNFIYLFSLSL